MRINYVIASWSGPRRGGGDGLSALRKQLAALDGLKHDLAQVTIVVPFNPAEPPEYTAYLEALPESRTPVVVLRRPENVGVSYGCWSHAYEAGRGAFDAYLFMEDDYYFVQDHFDRILADMLEGHGFVCGFVSRAHGREWPGNANGLASAAALEAIRTKFGRLPYDAAARDGGYTQESGQVRWGLAFQECGYKIRDITTRYACLHYYWQRHACDLIPGQPANDRCLFVPYEAPLNYAFIPFKRRHAGAQAILYGTGPTLSRYDYLEDDGRRLRVGLNSFIATGRPLDYYFFGHRDARAQAYMAAAAAFQGVKFGYVSVDGESDPIWLSLRQALDLGALPYHLTREIAYRDDIARHPLVDHAINFSALQFLVYTGVSKIHLVGCDATQIVSYQDSRLDRDRNVEVMLEAWRAFAGYARSRVKVVSINPVGLAGLFPGRST